MMSYLCFYMQKTIIDDNIVREGVSSHSVAGRSARLMALMIDVILLSLLTIPVQYFNITTWKNVPLLLIVSVLSVVYKPFFEFNFGGTIGKMIMRLEVLNYRYEKAKLSRILLRNVFYLIPNILSSLITFLVFNQPDFGDIHSFTEYLRMIQTSGMVSAFNRSVFLLSIIDGFFVLITPKRKALHDLIGGTVVVKRNFSSIN